jgi:hypothetical protein
LIATGTVGSLDRHSLQHGHHVTGQFGRISVLRGDHLPASRVEGDDATQLCWRRWIAKSSISARRFSFPSERVLERETGFSSEIVPLANGK